MKESFGDMLDRVCAKIKAHMGWDDAKLKTWLLADNPHFGGMSPNDYVLMRPDKFERIVDGMISGAGP
jgi:hypothetical protein